MLAEETFSARTFRAISDHHKATGVLYRVVFWGLVALLLCAVLFDAPISEALQDWPAHERFFFRTITDLGKSDWILIPALLGWALGYGAQFAPLTYSWMWACRSLSVISAYVFISIGLTGLVTVILKRLIGRARPMYLDELGPLHFKPFDLLDWSFHSFPSGHATTAVALAVVLRTFTNRRFRGWIVAFGIAIGLSRIVVGDHFLSDVIAGTFVGLAGAILVRDYFATRNLGMRLEGGNVRFRMFIGFGPLWRWLRQGHFPRMLK